MKKEAFCMRSNKGKTLPDKLHLSSHSSQAALEFLMTYGWAILVVIAAIGVLAYFGVLSPDQFLPRKCILPAVLACLDYTVENYKIVLVLQNTQGETIIIDKVTVSGNSQQCSDNQTVTVNNEAKAIITITKGQKFYSKKALRLAQRYDYQKVYRNF